jgi:hypothetical protein
MSPKSAAVVVPNNDGTWQLPHELDVSIGVDWAFCTGAPVRNMLKLCRTNGVQRIVTTAPLNGKCAESSHWRSTCFAVAPTAVGSMNQPNKITHIHFHWLQDAFCPEGLLPTDEDVPPQTTTEEPNLTAGAHAIAETLMLSFTGLEQTIPIGPTVSVLSVLCSIQESHNESLGSGESVPSPNHQDFRQGNCL